MNIELNDQETKIMVEMLTMAGYVMTQASDGAIEKAESMHELIQRIFQQAKTETMQESFDTDEDNNMIFPNADIMSGSEDSPLYLLKSYNEFAAADVVSQQLGLRDAAKAHNISEKSAIEGEFDAEFVDSFVKHQGEYLDEFAKNGFKNVQVTRIQLT